MSTRKFLEKVFKIKSQVCVLFWIYFIYFLLQKKLYLIVYPRNMSGSQE